MGPLEFVVTEGAEKGRKLPFPSKFFAIGSGAECQLRLEPGMVQPRHAEVLTDSTGKVWLRALNDSPVSVNGKAAQQAQLLPGTFVKLGALELTVRQVGAQNPSGTMATPTPLRQEAIESTARRPTPMRQEHVDATARRPTPFRNPVEHDSMQDDGHEPTYMSGNSGSNTALQPGQLIDNRYEIIELLATGGMGEVYKTRHKELGKTFALKLMRPELSSDPEFVARFKREAVAASRIGQQNIVDISDFNKTEDGRFYFAMEFLDGVTLASLVHREGALPTLRAVHISLQATRALAAAHELGIVHRDLKPENIMLLQRPGQSDFVKVLDFGVAKVAAGAGAGGQTAIGMVVGTPQYMSPEQAKAVAVDARSDIYSMGLIIYELLAGRPAFTGETPSILMVKHVTEAPPPLRTPELVDLPDDLEDLIFRMLEKDLNTRTQTMTEVVAVLDDVYARLRAAGTGPARPTRPQGATPAPRTSSGALRPVTGTQPTASGTRQPRPSGAYPVSGRQTAVDDPLLPKRSPLPFVVVGVLVLGLLGGGAFIALSKPPQVQVVTVPAKEPEAPVKPPPLPDKPAQPAKIKLTIESDPPSADVFEGDVQVGTTPLTLAREEGATVELKFSVKGYKPEIRKVGFAADAKVLVQLDKERKAGPGPRKPRGGGELQDDPYKQQDDLKDLPSGF